MKATYSQRLIKLSDLNHHQTFFAGRCAEWFLESSYFAVAQYVDTKDTVLLVLHGIDYKFPIFAGDIVTFESKVIHVGRSTLTVFVAVTVAAFRLAASARSTAPKNTVAISMTIQMAASIFSFLAIMFQPS